MVIDKTLSTVFGIFHFKYRASFEHCSTSKISENA